MKKILIISLLVLFSSSSIVVENNNEFAIKQKVVVVDNMNYLIVYSKYVRSGGSVSTAVSITNVTKDKLEVEKLRLEIEYYKRKMNKH